MWMNTLQKLARFRLGEYHRERRALLVQKLVQFKIGEQTGQRYVLFSFPLIGGWSPRPTAEESAWSTKELRQRYMTAQSATFEAFANRSREHLSITL